MWLCGIFVIASLSLVWMLEALIICVLITFKFNSASVCIFLWSCYELAFVLSGSISPILAQACLICLGRHFHHLMPALPPCPLASSTLMPPGPNCYSIFPDRFLLCQDSHISIAVSTTSLQGLHYFEFDAASLCNCFLWSCYRLACV